MKGVLKGFKYISTIFDEEQEDEIQIGLPTDVKHVAHIGMDGPATESPSWMKEFPPERPKSAPLDSKGEPIDPSSQKTSTDTELPKASRRRHSADSLAFEDSDQVLSNKSKGSRKQHKKASADGNVSKSNKTRRHHRKHSLSDQEGGNSNKSGGDGDHVPAESTSPSSPTARKLPDIPKKSRRKKVTDEISKMTSKAKAIASRDGAQVPPPPPTTTTTTDNNTSCPFSDPGSVGTDSTTTITCDNETCQISTKPSPPQLFVQEEKSNIVGCLDNSA